MESSPDPQAARARWKRSGGWVAAAAAAALLALYVAVLQNAVARGPWVTPQPAAPLPQVRTAADCNALVPQGCAARTAAAPRGTGLSP